MKKTGFKVLTASLSSLLLLSVGSAVYYRNLYAGLSSRGPEKVFVEVPVEDASKDQEIARLKEQIASLKETAGPAQEVQEVQLARQARAEGQRRPDQRMDLQELRVTDPERYQRMVEFYNSMNERITNTVEDRMIFFNELETAGMDQEQLENHNKLLEKLALLHETVENARNSDDPEQLREAMRSQFQNFREMSSLMEKEREFLLIDVGRKMGFSDEEAKLLKDYVVNAYEITSGRGIFGGGRGGMGGGRPPGGGQAGERQGN